MAALGFGLDSVAVSVGNDQETSLSAGVLQTQAHDGRDQLLQICLTLQRLRQLEHGREVQVFNRRHHGVAWDLAATGRL